MAGAPQFVTLIPIKKMERAIGFYTKALGARVTGRADGAMKNFWASAKVGGTDVWFIGVETWEKRKLAYHAFVVADIRRFVARLKTRGVKFEKAERMGPDTKIDGAIASDANGAAAFFKDSEGNLLMAWQAPKSG